MKRFAVLLMLLGVGLFSLALVGCGEKTDTAPAGGGTDVTTPAGGEEEPAGGEEEPAGGAEEPAGEEPAEPAEPAAEEEPAGEEAPANP
jgi:hypothetical protein